MKFLAVLCLRPASRRPPHGGRGLKSLCLLPAGQVAIRRPPHGGRGLKFCKGGKVSLSLMSPPARGAWIEIRSRTEWEALIHVAPRTGGVD